MLTSTGTGQSNAKLRRQVNRNRRVLRNIQKGISKFQKQVNDQQKNVSKKLDLEITRIDSLMGSVMSEQYEIKTQTRKLSIFIVDSLSRKTLKRLSSIESSLRIYFVIVVMLILILLGGAIYLIFIKRVINLDAQSDPAIVATLKVCKQISEGLRKLEQRVPGEKAEPGPPGDPEKEKEKEKDIDHTFYLRVAEELFRMRLRLSKMPEETKGISAVSNAIKRLEDELYIKGYEVIDLTGQDYDDGMTVVVKDFLPQDDMPKGQKKILRTLKPMVKYKTVIISHGEIEVAMSTEELAQK
jgi:hypothetical protein